MGAPREFGNIKETTPARAEVGFFFSGAELEKIRLAVKTLGYQKVVFDNPFTQSIYFAEQTGNTTPGGYVRLRRYSQTPNNESFEVTPDSDWYLEGKISGDPKERLLIPAKIALEIMISPSYREQAKNLIPAIYRLLSKTGPMFPVVATQWQREHYVLNRSNRATIDTELTYYAFLPGTLNGTVMSHDTGCRIEWKSLTGYIPTDQLHDINLSPIPPKWHEATIRKMYIEWLSSMTKNE